MNTKRLIFATAAIGATMLSISACSSQPIEPENPPIDAQALEIIDAKIADKAQELKRSNLVVQSLQLDVERLESDMKFYNDQIVIIKFEIRNAKEGIRQIFRNRMMDNFQRIFKETKDADPHEPFAPYEDRIMHYDGLG